MNCNPTYMDYHISYTMCHTLYIIQHIPYIMYMHMHTYTNMHTLFLTLKTFLAFWKFDVPDVPRARLMWKLLGAASPDPPQAKDKRLPRGPCIVPHL